MRSALRAAVCVGMIVAVSVSSGSAQDAKGKKKAQDGKNSPIFAIPKEITLTSEQQTKLDEIKNEQAPKVVELNKKLDAVLTDEQKTARKDASAKAKEEGKKGKEMTAAVEEALKLTDEQKKARKESEEELNKLRQTVREQIHGFLTEEQRAHYKLPKAKKAA